MQLWSHLGKNSISWERKPGWNFLTKTIYIIFRWTDLGYILGEKIISKSIYEQLFSSDFLPQIISVKIELLINWKILKAVEM